jgi:DmsE family decaheme c-type cytochrome
VPEFVGADTCAVCHDELATAFARSAHGRAGEEGSCESCHGPGSLHVDAEGDPALIRSFGGGMGAVDDTDACLACHGRQRHVRGWGGSEHAGAALTCQSCHTVHRESAESPLLRSGQSDLCYECHAEVRAQFHLTVTHPVERGNMECSDCHNPHRATDRRMLGGFKQMACLTCHSEYRGPWFFEHEAVAVEGCVACHTPHGSVNRFLLTYQRVGDLCIQCHSAQSFFHVAVDGEGERTTGYNDCTRCHTEIHGSNNSALFLN